jgi:hypothetical protein
MLVHLRRGSVTAVILALTWAATPALAATTPAPTPSASEGQATATAPQDLVSFGIAPAGLERPDGRPFLSYTAAPGSTIYDHVAVLNQDDQPLSLQVYSGDVVQADAGLSVRPQADASVDAGAWIAVEAPPQIDVPAQTTDAGVGYVIVPFTLTIPTNAQPGDHLGGIVASLVTVGSGGESSPSIQLDQRVAARVYIRVDGDLAPGLVIANLGATWVPGGVAGAGSVELTYTLRNTGNVRMAVEPSARVTGPFDLLARSAAGSRVDVLLPGAEVHQSITVTGVWPLVRETVTVSARAVATAAGDDPGLGTVTTSINTGALPWAGLAVLALLLALIVALVARRRGPRRGRRQGSGNRVVGHRDTRATVGLGVPTSDPAPVDRRAVARHAARPVTSAGIG